MDELEQYIETIHRPAGEENGEPLRPINEVSEEELSKISRAEAARRKKQTEKREESKARLAESKQKGGMARSDDQEKIHTFSQDQDVTAWGNLGGEGMVHTNKHGKIKEHRSPVRRIGHPISELEPDPIIIPPVGALTGKAIVPEKATLGAQSDPVSKQPQPTAAKSREHRIGEDIRPEYERQISRTPNFSTLKILPPLPVPVPYDGPFKGRIVNDQTGSYLYVLGGYVFAGNVAEFAWPSTQETTNRISAEQLEGDYLIVIRTSVDVTNGYFTSDNKPELYVPPPHPSDYTVDLQDSDHVDIIVGTATVAVDEEGNRTWGNFKQRLRGDIYVPVFCHNYYEGKVAYYCTLGPSYGEPNPPLSPGGYDDDHKTEVN